MRWTSRGKMNGLRVAITMAVVLFSGCIVSQPEIKYQPSDQNAVPGQTMLWSFGTDPVGELPREATVFSGIWSVRAEADAPGAPNALCQTGTAEFPALLLGDMIYTDIVMSAHFKPVSGSTDQAAGLIFRVQDKDNYYILRANALENNVNIYKYAGGKRSAIKGGSAKVVSGQWQELRVEAIGNSIHGFLNGQLVVEATDNTFKAGMVGLWTKADSATCFADIRASALASAASGGSR